MNKIDYKKELKELYTGKKDDFKIINVPSINYLQIHGSGDPNTDPNYRSSIEALYATAYAIKFICKKKEMDFTVMPLEGLWYAEDYAVFESREKNKWSWTMLIMLPPFVTEHIFREAIDTVKKKKDNPKISEVFFEQYEEGLCIQTLHIGSYDNEGPIISQMYRYLSEHGYQLSGKHHEIYLSDPRKNNIDKLKTIIRQPIKACETE
jgi:hypothetical protein